MLGQIVGLVRIVGASEPPAFNPLGEDLLPLLVLALAAAMVFGNLAAVFKPRESTEAGELARAPLARTLIMVTIGLVAAVWSAASLLGG